MTSRFRRCHSVLRATQRTSANLPAALRFRDGAEPLLASRRPIAGVSSTHRRCARTKGPCIFDLESRPLDYRRSTTSATTDVLERKRHCPRRSRASRFAAPRLRRIGSFASRKWSWRSPYESVPMRKADSLAIGHALERIRGGVPSAHTRCGSGQTSAPTTQG
jgi:hypothetical protein